MINIFNDDFRDFLALLNQFFLGNTDGDPKIKMFIKKRQKQIIFELQIMRRLKKILIIIFLIPLLNIILITFCSGLIEGSWWKYSRGADFRDFIEFDEILQANSILV